MKSDSNFKDFGERRGSRVECFGVPPGLDSITNKVWDLSVWSLVSTDECLYNLLDSRDTSQVSRLDLTNADKITDKGMQVVAHNMAALEDLSLENAYRITDTGLKEVVTHCLRLRLLNLSGCLGIPGLSFALLGQHACNIVQLNVSGCSQITSWAFMKVFQGCINIEDLDLSYCSQITDRDIKVLRECCPGLKQLILKECVQISDIGIVSLKTSQTLKSIDLSRKSLTSRITDVSLLALAEGCNDLCFISVSGCELITDVGISWLANGCKKLVQLNISNCFKVSNAGLRYLGEECHELRTIILKNVKKISDVGIRFLACGCNKLEYLNASGLYLLTDGARRAFGLEGIQSLGASLASRSIRRLNLRGCFHISTFSLKAMASMANLEFLDLSGCTLLTFEGMDKIANACKHLSHLSLASCGDCITNDMLYRISPKLLSLKSLDLSYCRMVGRIALKGLSHCTSLTSLNLTGCISITNEGILSLGEGRYREGLQELNLSNCSKIDDTAIAWIADSFQAMEEEAGTVSLTTLVLTGTKVSVSAVQAIRDRFVYSSLKINKNFFGFLALSRCSDRKSIRQYNKKINATIKIQALIRRKKWSHLTRQIKERSIMNVSATKIQSICRGYLSRQMLLRLRHDKWLKCIMAQRLQCFIRFYLAKARFRRLKYQLWKIKARTAAVKIQQTFRGWIGYRLSTKVRKERDQLVELQTLCCTKIQAIVRMYLAKMKRLLRLERRITWNKVLSEACISIQCQYRKILAHQMIASLKAQRQQIQRNINNAAIILQRLVRAFLFKLLLETKVELKRRKHSNMTIIQSWFRCIIAKEEFKKRKSMKLYAKISHSAVVIQCFIRRMLSISHLQNLVQERTKLERVKEQSALVISCSWRQFDARRECNKRRKSREAQMQTIAQVQVRAASKLAAFFRGHKGRLIARKVRLDRSKRWKEMWSDEYGCCFYYNKVTGESRWKKPQELLDLEPRPLCSNCSLFDAQLECKVCDEFFCISCFESVHYGGKRRSHSFRALYDFYDKRIGYEVNEFPSIWPAKFENKRSYDTDVHMYS